MKPYQLMIPASATIEMSRKISPRGFHKRSNSVDFSSQIRRNSSGAESNYSFASSASNVTTPPDSPKTFVNVFSVGKCDFIDLNEINKHSNDYEKKLLNGGNVTTNLFHRKPSVHQIIEFPESDAFEGEEEKKLREMVQRDSIHKDMKQKDLIRKDMIRKDIIKSDDKSFKKRIKHFFI